VVRVQVLSVLNVYLCCTHIINPFFEPGDNLILHAMHSYYALYGRPLHTQTSQTRSRTHLGQRLVELDQGLVQAVLEDVDLLGNHGVILLRRIHTAHLLLLL